MKAPVLLIPVSTLPDQQPPRAIYPSNSSHTHNKSNTHSPARTHTETSAISYTRTEQGPQYNDFIPGKR